MLSGLGGGGLKSCARKYRKLAKKHSLAIDADAQDLPHSRPGWVGLQEVKADQNIYGLKELLEKFGLRLVPWDGITTRLLVDSEDRVIGILGGQPKNAKEWEKICKEAVEALENGRGLCTFLDKQLNHGRGDFPAVAVGISHGNGTQAPGVLSQGKNTKVLGDLLGMSCFAKMAGFANCLFATYFPRAYALYQENLEELIQWDPSLRRNFPKTAFAAASFNFGPKTECYPHRDWANVSWGECAVTALGDYNADEGGHLVLWDLGLVVRFPPGSTVLIPSALVRHSNTPIAPCEHRYSFAQYSAGGLFRWVGRGFRLAKAKPAESTDIQQSRWTKGMGVFSKLSEF